MNEEQQLDSVVLISGAAFRHAPKSGHFPGIFTECVETQMCKSIAPNIAQNSYPLWAHVRLQQEMLKPIQI